MNELLEFKKRVISEFIRKKEAMLKELKEDQQNQYESSQDDDIDFSDRAESPREQIMDEATQKTGAIDFLVKELEVLKSIQKDVVHDVVSLGSLVRSNVSYFLVGVAMDHFDFENKKIMGISMDSPVFMKMQGFKRKGEFHFGSTEYVILDIV